MYSGGHIGGYGAARREACEHQDQDKDPIDREEAQDQCLDAVHHTIPAAVRGSRFGGPRQAVLFDE
jgi:hypothetical protein